MSATDLTRRENTVTVATPEPGTALALPEPSSVSATVARYADDLGHCLAFAARIVDTPIVPASFWPAVVVYTGDNATTLKSWEWDVRTRHPRESAEQFAARRDVAVATTGGTILLGGDLDLPWSAAISGIYFVGGRPSLMAEQMRALVLSRGHYFRTVERTAERCIVEVKRRGDAGDPIRYEFTIEQAVRAGYVKGKGPNANSKGGNDKYNSDPATMLYARATSIACKSEFPDVIRGMAVAELGDDEPVDITATTSVARVDAKAILGENRGSGAGMNITVSGRVADEADIAAAAQRYDQGATSPAAASPAARAPQQQEVAAEVGPAATSPEPSSTSVETLWTRINAWFSGSGLRDVNGPGQKAARLKVINAMVADEGRVITQGRELTEDEARIVLDTLTANGISVVADVLTPGSRVVEEQAAAEATYQGQSDAQAEAEQTSQPEQDLEPQLDDPWNGQGGE